MKRPSDIEPADKDRFEGSTLAGFVRRNPRRTAKILAALGWTVKPPEKNVRLDAPQGLDKNMGTNP